MKRTSRRIAGLSLACMWAFGLCTGATQARTTPAEQITALTTAYERTSGAAVSVTVVDIRTGKQVVAIRQSVPRAPASNQKILTSAFALARLGADYQIATLLIRRGDDLVVAGNFDPTFGDPVLAKAGATSIYADLDAWAATVKKRIGARIAGDIIIPSRQAGASHRHPDWPANQYKRWYVAPVAEVNFNNNCFDVTFSLAGAQPTPHLSPTSYLIAVTNRTRRGSKHLWDLRIGDGDASLTVTGTIKVATRDPLSTAANSPPLLFGRVLADRLKRAGVTLVGSVRAARPETIDMTGSEVIARKRTDLGLALMRANKRSLNMAAEGVFLCAGGGTWTGGAKLMTATLSRAYGLKAGELIVRDGSGMSRSNGVTTRAMAAVLTGVLKTPGAAAFIRSLPVSGVDGTLSQRLGGAHVKRVLAKTGYISGVSALSGYALDAKSKPAYAFSILINRLPAGKNWQAKQFQDAVAAALVDATG